MAKKVFNEDLQSRMRRAIAMIGRGVNQDKPEMEQEGRRQLAVAKTENEILLGMEHFTAEDVTALATLLFESAAPVVDTQEAKTVDSADPAIDFLEEQAIKIPNDARELAPPLNPTREERIAAMRKGHEREQARYPRPDLLEDPDDIE